MGTGDGRDRIDTSHFNKLSSQVDRFGIICGQGLDLSNRIATERLTIGGHSAQLNGKLSDGLFIQPTVLADVTSEMRVAREEIFGPVITILKYHDLNEAISLANNTEFGLGGIVFGSDQDKALEVAEAMNTGSVGLNFFASNHAAPFGGRNDSGLGVEYGPEGLAAYLSYKSIHRR
jgi:aldehyde dehydrogenase (NAD+)